MTHAFRIPLELAPQPEGGFTVTCPVLPELITEGDTVGEALASVSDAFRAVLEIYEEEYRPLPDSLTPESYISTICRSARRGFSHSVRYREVSRQLTRLGCKRTNSPLWN